MTKKLDLKAAAERQVKRDISTAAGSQAPFKDRFKMAETLLGAGTALPSASLQSVIHLDDIQARVQSTRSTDMGHVETLGESIKALGLIEPIVVDRTHRLLAGGHRLEALRRLRDTDPEAFERWFAAGVPVRIFEGVDAEKDPDHALRIEIAENEHRRDYSPLEVKALVERLKASGYRDTVGRPKAGEKALGPALEIIVQKSIKTIRKMLAEEQNSPSPPLSPLRALHRSLLKNGPSVPPHLASIVGELQRGLEAEFGQSNG